MAQFSVQIDLGVLKCDTSPKLELEIDLRLRCRHLGDGLEVTTPSHIV